MSVIDKMERPEAIDPKALREAVETVARQPVEGELEYKVTSFWKGKAASLSLVEGPVRGGKKRDRKFSIEVDSPEDQLGGNQAPNPQEYMIAAVNSCLITAFASGAAERGLRLDRLEVETRGKMNLAGFMGLDSRVPPGFNGLVCVVKLKCRAPSTDIADLHHQVIASSPNYFNISKMIPIEVILEIEK